MIHFLKCSSTTMLVSHAEGPRPVSEFLDRLAIASLPEMLRFCVTSDIIFSFFLDTKT